MGQRSGTSGSEPPGTPHSSHAPASISVLPCSGSFFSTRTTKTEKPLVPIGDPKAITSFAKGKDEGLAPLALPASVTGSAITAVLSYDPVHSPHRLRITIVPLLFVLALATLLQLLLVSGLASMVHGIVQREGVACHKGLLSLSISCNAVFIITSIVSLKESLEMHRWLDRIPSVLQRTPLKFQKAQQGAHTFYTPADGVGITKAMRCAIYALAVFPKVLVTVLITIFGSGYLLNAQTDADVLLNCVGMVFISEIDSLIYRFALSRSLMNLVTSFPPLGLSWEAYRANYRERFMERNTPWLAAVVLVILMFVLELSWCGTILGAP